jgi:hypothetical protein
MEKEFQLFLREKKFVKNVPAIRTSFMNTV